MKNIAIVAKTSGLEFDDRIRKECIALSKKNNVFIYIVFDDNREEEGITSYGVKYKSFTIKTRNILPQSKFLFIKSLEYYLLIKKYLRNVDLVWAHEEYSFIFALLLKKNKCVWDLHEIPIYINNLLMKKVFHFIEKKSYKIVHANKYRINYLKKINTIKNLEKHTYLNNFPDLQFIDSKKEDKNYNKFKSWLGNSEYIYLQGLSSKVRQPINVIESVIKTKFKAIVVGNIDIDSWKYLNKKYSNLDSFIFTTGMVNQLEITKYIIDSKFTIIIYDGNSANKVVAGADFLLNQIYCEPNRLYQSIVLGKPVITGKNPPMKDVVEKYNLGISLNGYGDDKSEIINAIKEINNKYDQYILNINKNSKRFIWKDKCVCKIIH